MSKTSEQLEAENKRLLTKVAALSQENMLLRDQLLDARIAAGDLSLGGE